MEIRETVVIVDKGADGSLTVEASFITSIIILTIVGIIVFTLYRRDCMAALAAAEAVALDVCCANAENTDGYPVFTISSGSITGGEGKGYAEVTSRIRFPFGRASFTAYAQRTRADEVRQLIDPNRRRLS